jgi:hypothetical protein
MTGRKEAADHTNSVADLLWQGIKSLRENSTLLLMKRPNTADFFRNSSLKAGAQSFS